MKFLKRMGWPARIGLLILLVPLIGIGLIYLVMSGKDAEHAAFFDTGKTIKTFVKKYGDAIASDHRDGGNKLSYFYADAFHSPKRGSWYLEEGNLVGGALTQHMQAPGGADFNKADVLAEWRTYFDKLNTIDVIHSKIHLIEQISEGTVVFTVKFTMDARDDRDRPLQVRHFYRWHLERVEDDVHEYGWRITRDELVEGVRVTGVQTVFESVDIASVGVDYTHKRDPKLDIKKYGDQMKFAVVEHAMGGL